MFTAYLTVGVTFHGDGRRLTIKTVPEEQTVRQKITLARYYLDRLRDLHRSNDATRSTKDGKLLRGWTLGKEAL
jgi:hypothetical protein